MYSSLFVNSKTINEMMQSAIKIVNLFIGKLYKKGKKMQVGLSINLAFQGITSIKTCETSFNRLKKAINNVGGSVKNLKRDLAAIKRYRKKEYIKFI